jgi:hypothetical protein
MTPESQRTEWTIAAPVPFVHKLCSGMRGNAARALAANERVWGQIAASVAAIVVTLLLIAPALWNGYPLLQYDTGGYIARVYEGYLVPSRSTVFGYYLHLGEDAHFWINIKLQALATLWILQAVARVFGLTRPVQIAMIGIALALTTALPWLSSLLLTDIFAGLSVLALFLLVVHGDKFVRFERAALFLFTAFAAASHNATLAVLAGLCAAAWLGRRFFPDWISLRGTRAGGLSLAAGALMLLGANFMVSGKLAWTPGGYGIAFSRILQDGIVVRYLKDNCAREQLKLCPYRHGLPAGGDEFLWGKSVFDRLGRFEGLGDEMRHIVLASLTAYPSHHLFAATASAAKQLTMVATGEGVHSDLMHTHRIIEQYLPQHTPFLQTSRQHRGELSFAGVNRVHVSVAYGSMLMIGVFLAYAIWRRKVDHVALLTATVTLAILGNAFVCGALSGPHNRYGARIVWIATFAVLIILMRSFGGGDNRERAELSSGL